MDIIERLKFDSARCEATYSKGVAKNIDEAVAEIERLRKGIQDYLNGDFEPRLKKLDKCKHGFYGYEECGRCVDEYFQNILDG